MTVSIGIKTVTEIATSRRFKEDLRFFPIGYSFLLARYSFGEHPCVFLKI